MGGGHHHHERLQIPDWKIYQVGDHTPNLQQLQQRLAAKGLKDPWIRNEVWRFDTRMHGTHLSRKLASFGFRPRAMIGGTNRQYLPFTICFTIIIRAVTRTRYVLLARALRKARSQ